MHSQQLIIDNFSRSATTYDDYAQIQIDAGNRLSEDLKVHCRDLVNGPVLEIGCGTGHLSVEIMRQFAHRSVTISDISDKMLAASQKKIFAELGENLSGLELSLIDAENFESPGKFALIISAFTLQWLFDLDGALERLLNSLTPGGKLFFSVPANKSFPEWRSLCRSKGVPFTGNPLPDAQAFRQSATANGCSLRLYEETFTMTYPSLKHFLRGLKALGASTPVHGMRLTISELNRLIDHANAKHPASFPTTYHLLRGHFTRDSL